MRVLVLGYGSEICGVLVFGSRGLEMSLVMTNVARTNGSEEA